MRKSRSFPVTSSPSASLHSIPAASRIRHVMKMVNNRVCVCVLHLSSRGVLNYFANWLREVSTRGALCSSAKLQPVLRHTTERFPESLETKSRAPARAEHRREMKGSAMTFNLMFLRPFSAEQPSDCARGLRLHAVPIAGAAPGCPPSLCTEINGSRSDPGIFWALTIPLDSAGAAPSVALEAPRLANIGKSCCLLWLCISLFLKHSPWMFQSYFFFFHH